jgi:hypothetical protein
MIKYIKEADLADPIMINRAVVLFKKFVFTLSSPGMRPAADYATTGRWDSVWYQFGFRVLK